MAKSSWRQNRCGGETLPEGETTHQHEGTGQDRSEGTRKRLQYFAKGTPSLNFPELVYLVWLMADAMRTEFRVDCRFRPVHNSSIQADTFA